MNRHIKEHGVKYASILGVFPLIFLANIAMPENMSFATAEELGEMECKFAWADYYRKANELDIAEHRSVDNPDDEFLRKAAVKAQTEVDKIKVLIEKVC